MCTVCGCGNPENNTRTHSSNHLHDHEHDHAHSHDHGHSHNGLHFGDNAAGVSVGGMSTNRLVKIEQDILSKNDQYAKNNRQYFHQQGIFALNLVSSPGAGKTSLLVKTIECFGNDYGFEELSVIEGDQQTHNDAERIRAAGARAIQINTGKGCHLDAHMVGHALESLSMNKNALLMIENVGNLVCPASFDLGEAHKVVILSVTEGEDKPLKYPDMFRAADLMLLNKCDLLPHVEFSVETALNNARKVNPGIQCLQISAKTAEGMTGWLEWIRDGQKNMAV